MCLICLIGVEAVNSLFLFKFPIALFLYHSLNVLYMCKNGVRSFNCFFNDEIVRIFDLVIFCSYLWLVSGLGLCYLLTLSFSLVKFGSSLSEHHLRVGRYNKTLKMR